MKVFMLMTSSGPLVVLTSHASVLDEAVARLLAHKGIGKFLAFEIPLALARRSYGLHFDIVEAGLKESDEFRVLDEDGDHIFRLFRFGDLGPPVAYEATGYVRPGAQTRAK